METQRSSGKLETRTGVEADEFFSIETHGIDVIPLRDRHGQPRELFFIWMGSNIIFTYVIYGVIAGSFGLSFWPTVAALVLGNLLYLVVGVLSLTGPRTGTSTMVVSRAAFGWMGNIPACFFNWLTVLGFCVVNAVVGTLALLQIAAEIGLTETTTLKAICMVLAVLVTFVVAIFGHATVVVLQRWFTYGLAVGAIFLAAFVIPKAQVSGLTLPLAADSALGAWLLAFFVFGGGGPYSYYTVPGDYSRYLHPDTPKRPVVLWTAFGAMIPAIVLGLIGIAAATATDMTDPVGGLAALTPKWFLVPFLLLLVGGSTTNNFINLYSSGLNLQAMGVPLPRSRSVFVDAILVTGGTIYALFISDFTTSLVNFLSLMVIWIAPWAGIFLVDMYLRRITYDPIGLHQIREGPYRYEQGWNLRGLAALAVGIVAGGAFANSTLWRGPLVDLIAGGDLSVFVGLVAGAGVYYGLMRSVIRRQLAETSPTIAVGGHAVGADPPPQDVTGA